MPTPSTKPDSRDKILDSAEVLFARRGFSGVGLAGVAESVDLSKSSLFHHFTSKAQLYAAVISRIVSRIEDDLMRSLAEGGTPAARLTRWLDVLTDTLATHRTYARLLLRSLFEDDDLSGDLPEEREANDHLRNVLGACAALLREGIADGSFRRVDVGHTLQTIIGINVYHFASGSFGDELLGRSVFSRTEVERRKREVKQFVRHALWPVDAPVRSIG